MEISASFLLFVFSAAFTPGPNNIMLMSSGLNHGVRASLPHLFGIVLGVPTMFLAVGFGFTFFLEQTPSLYAVIKILGILYLLYLAWLIASSAPSSLDSDAAAPFTFFQAALFQWVNPKAWMMGTGAIAAFSNADAALGGQIFIMAFVFMLMAIPSAGVWLVLGSWLKRFFRNARYLIIFNRTMAIILVLSVAPIVVDLVGQYIG